MCYVICRQLCYTAPFLLFTMPSCHTKTISHHSAHYSILDEKSRAFYRRPWQRKVISNWLLGECLKRKWSKCSVLLYFLRIEIGDLRSEKETHTRMLLECAPIMFIIRSGRNYFWYQRRYNKYSFSRGWLRKTYLSAALTLAPQSISIWIQATWSLVLLVFAEQQVIKAVVEPINDEMFILYKRHEDCYKL